MIAVLLFILRFLLFICRYPDSNVLFFMRPWTVKYMNWYWISKRISVEGVGLRVTVMLKDWWGLRWRTIWFNHKEINENDWETNYADYNIEDHLVTKF